MTEQEFKAKWPGFSGQDDVDEAMELKEEFETEISPNMPDGFIKEQITKHYNMLCQMLVDYETSKGNNG